MKHTFIRHAIVNGSKYDVYRIYCVNHDCGYEDCGYDVINNCTQKVVITFVGYPTDEDIKKHLDNNWLN